MPTTTSFRLFARSFPKLAHSIYRNSAPFRSATLEVATDVAKQAAQQELEDAVCNTLGSPRFSSPTKRTSTALVQAVRGRFAVRQGAARAVGMPVLGFVIGHTLTTLRRREVGGMGVRVLVLNTLTCLDHQVFNLSRQQASLLYAGRCTMLACFNFESVLPWILQQLGWLAQETLDESVDGGGELV